MLVVCGARTPRHSKLQMMQCFSPAACKVNGVRDGRVLPCALLKQEIGKECNKFPVSCAKVDCILIEENVNILRRPSPSRAADQC